MKYATSRPFADPEAERKLLKIANVTEAVQDGHIHVEKAVSIWRSCRR